jgi:hypothetical protein
VGRTLSEGHGTWTANPSSYLYQWLRCAAGSGCAPISGATAQSYTVSAADAGATLEVQETAVNTNGASLPATSVPSAIVLPPAPVLVRAPAISGTARVGSTLFAVGAQWSQNPSAFAFQWWRCSAATTCTAIPGANWEAYTLVSADQGRLITVSETAANAGGTSAPASSSAVGPVAAAPTPPPTPTPTPNPPPPGGTGPSLAKVRLALHSVISAPPGRVRGRPTAFTVPFAAPGAGRLAVAWTVRVPRAGRTPVTLATLRVSITRAGRVRLRLVLTARGKALLAHSRRVWVRASGSFTPKGHRAITAVRGFWLSR